MYVLKKIPTIVTEVKSENRGGREQRGIVESPEN